MISEEAILEENIKVVLEPFINEVNDIVEYDSVEQLKNIAMDKLNEIFHEVKSQENQDNILFLFATIAILGVMATDC